MKVIQIGLSDIQASAIGLGCMRLVKLGVDGLESMVLKCLDLGINFFDHADIYGAGESERLFGEVLKCHPQLRDKMIIQSKCGIRKGFYDNSKAHIMASVDGILDRLKTSYLDILLIHRPDALMEVEEIAQAFSELESNGKVRYFGVSNMNPYQIELLQRALKKPLIANQMQLSIVHSGMIDAGIHVNMKTPFALDADGFTLSYCQREQMTIQAWSVLQASWEEKTFLNHPNYEKLNGVLDELAIKYQVTPSAIAIAWILRHPAQIQAIVGTASITHLEEMVKASEVYLTREEWYRLYLSVDKKLP